MRFSLSIIDRVVIINLNPLKEDILLQLIVIIEKMNWKNYVRLSNCVILVEHLQLFNIFITIYFFLLRSIL